MNLFEFLMLKYGGFTPSQLSLPDSALDGAGSRPLSIIEVYPPKDRKAFGEAFLNTVAERERRESERRRSQPKGTPPQ